MSDCLQSTLLTEPSPLLFLNSFSLVIPGEVEAQGKLLSLGGYEISLTPAP